VPVATTIALVMAMRRRAGAGSGPLFRDPDALRERIERAVEAGPRRDASLGAVDALERAYRAYDEQAEADMYRYLSDSRDFDKDPAAYDADIFDELDRRRRAAFLEVDVVRERLLDLLTAEEWEAAFAD